MKYDKEAVLAADYIRTVANGKKIETEQEVTLYRDDEEVTFGTFDAYCEGHLFDLKTGRERRNYVPQMAVYVAAICQRDNIDRIEVHLFYSAFNKVDKFTLTREEAEELSYKIIDSVNDPTRSPYTSEYCNWCARKGSCTALNTMSLTIAEKLDMVTKHDIAAIDDPVIMGQYREVADAVECWAKAVKSKCGDFNEIQGYSKTTRKGKKTITDITGALIHSGLPSEQFVKACTISYPKLKKQFAEHEGVSEEEADRELTRRISSVTKEGHPVKYWRKDK